MTVSNRSIRKNTKSSRKMDVNFSLHAVDSNASVILAKLKKNNESCRTCHFFIHTSADERVCKDDTKCRLKDKPVRWYNLCHKHKKLNITEMVKEDKVWIDEASEVTEPENKP